MSGWAPSSLRQRRGVRPAAGIARALLALGFALAVRLPAQAGELGVFFVTAPASAFARGPRQGSQIALRQDSAYAVIGLAWDRDERLWLRLNVPERTHIAQGEGWTPLTAQELAARNSGPIEVYASPIESGRPAAAATLVPASDVKLLPRPSRSDSATGPGLPELQWHPLRYATRRPLLAWVAAAQGTYRPGRSPAFLSSVYRDMSDRKVPAATLQRLLAGIVRPGDTAQAVRWAWGEPLRTAAEGPEGQRIAVWEYAEGLLRFEGATVKEVR